MFRVLLADYHLLLLHALKELLDPEYHVVGLVAGDERLIDSAIRLKPDIIIADLAMPRMDGLECLERIKKFLPRVRVVMLTANEDPDVAVHALRCGVSGYLLKALRRRTSSPP